MKPKARRALSFAAAGYAAFAASRAATRRARRLDLRGRVVLVTGASRGLGLVLVRHFAELGARIAVCARSENELSRVRTEFSWLGDEFFAMACDVGVREQVHALVSAVERNLGPVEVLVNNAGTIVVGPLEDQNVEAFEDAMQTNFWGAVYCAMAVLPGMKQRHRGRIVNIASIGGVVSVPHLVPYSASKFALVGYSEGLRAELSKYRVWVTTVCPGLMRTGSPRNADFTGQHEKEYQWFKISDSLPGSSISATRAAKKIIDACIHGDAEVYPGAMPRIASFVHGLMPGVVSDVLGVLNTRLLPAPVQNGSSRRWKGAESETRVTRSVLTRLTTVAEQENNQR